MTYLKAANKLWLCQFNLHKELTKHNIWSFILVDCQAFSRQVCSLFWAEKDLNIYFLWSKTSRCKNSLFGGDFLSFSVQKKCWQRGELFWAGGCVWFVIEMNHIEDTVVLIAVSGEEWGRSEG